jgi:hypothetical protein
LTVDDYHILTVSQARADFRTGLVFLFRLLPMYVTDSLDFLFGDNLPTQ